MNDKSASKSKTVWAGILVILLGVFQSLAGWDWIELVGNDTAGLIVSAIGIGIIILRALTKSRVKIRVKKHILPQG